jgi:hypothetical protein
MTTLSTNQENKIRKAPLTAMMYLIFGAAFLYLSVGSWDTEWEAPGLKDWWWYLLAAVAMVVFSVVLQRSQNKSWSSIAQMTSTGANEPRDEREWRLFEKASSYSFTVMYGFTFCLMLVFFFVSVPSNYGMMELIVAFLYFQLGARALIYWLIGAR